MAFLLDTESLFALLRPAPEAHPVIRWKRGVRNEQVFISVVSVGELVDAIARLRSPVVREQWQTRLHEHLPNAFHGRILPVDQRTAEDWGSIRATRTGRQVLETEESLLLATARVNDYTLVGRRAPYHRKLGVAVIDPHAGGGR